MCRPAIFTEWDELYGHVTSGHLREVFKSVPTGVVALSAIIDHAPTVMVATSFAPGVSFDPPLASVAIQNGSRTWAQLRTAERIGISVLGDAHRDLVLRMSSRDVSSRFDGVSWTRLPSGAVTLYDSPVWLEVRLHQEFEVGDHTLAVVEIVGSSLAPEHPALVHRNSTFTSA